MSSGGFLFSESGDQGPRFRRRRSFFAPDKPAAPTDAQPAAPKSTARTWTVTQLVRLIKVTLGEQLPSTLVLAGEISNLARHGSGHLYFRLKDDNALVPAVMWRSDAARLKFVPADGMAVLATGHVDVFERDGRLQFYVRKLEPVGQGALELAVRQLAEKLRAEGLFDKARKRPIPRFPLGIAIVTSATGAAIEDIGNTLRRRWPIARQWLFPVPVQGEGAARAIADAIAQANRMAATLGGIDVMIVGRGGGSLEDLQAFNDEHVARAIFASTIPVITGVGHEIDTTIADAVADARAITPTAAAERAAPVRDDVLQDVEQWRYRLDQALQHHRRQSRAALAALCANPVLARPLEMTANRQQWVDERAAALLAGVREHWRQAAQRLERDTAVLQRIEPHRALRTAAARLTDTQHRLGQAAAHKMAAAGRAADRCRWALRAARPEKSLAAERATLHRTAQTLGRTVAHAARAHAEHLDHLERRLLSLDPKAVLRRGYSITRRRDTGAVITAADAARPGERITTELAHEVTFESEVVAPPTPAPEDTERKRPHE